MSCIYTSALCLTPLLWTPHLQAIQVTFIVSLIYTGLGLLRMGWITKFLSHAVIGGFTTGAAITIGMGQVRFIRVLCNPAPSLPAPSQYTFPPCCLTLPLGLILAQCPQLREE